MTLEELSRNAWIRAAHFAHMVLSQSLSDAQLDELVWPVATAAPVPVPRAA